ncbi:MAG: hypothetical protein KO217_01105 [Methanobacteriaceae archaeon]|nr:MAG: hypothetical protein CIT01_01505 [Methanobacterium sp. BRmetb2]MCC7557268.1 hypothetical protein [Methanobacteriaceae archaeon]
MPLIAQNHLQFIIEVALILYAGVMFLLNIVPLSMTIVLFMSLILCIGFSLMFGIDTLLLLLQTGHYELTHSFGPIALLAAVTALATLPIMKESGVKTGSLRGFIVLLIIVITIAGGLMHRSFLLLWLMGLLIGYFIISKSFRQKSVFTIKKLLLFAGIGIVGFGSLEMLSRVLEMPVLSPFLRIFRIESFADPSIAMVLKNSTLFGHEHGACYWGDQCLNGTDGYITLPMSLIISFGLPFPLFYGILVSKKDVIDYMLPGIFGFTFDFGYIGLIVLLLWCLATIFLGFKILSIYREKRENGDKRLMGREALLIGSLTAFIAQSIVGLFLMNRSINGTALLTFLFLGALVTAHIMSLKTE